MVPRRRRGRARRPRRKPEQKRPPGVSPSLPDPAARRDEAKEVRESKRDTSHLRVDAQAKIEADIERYAGRTLVARGRVGELPARTDRIKTRRAEQIHPIDGV